MSKSPAFQFYPKDFLGSARVAMMTDEEVGAYIRALCYCWINETLPADEEKFCRLLKISTVVARVVQPMFNQHAADDSLLVHERLEQEREKQRLWSEKSSYGGKKSAEARKKARVVQPPFNDPCKGGARVVQPKGNIASSSSSSSSSPNVLKKKVKKEKVEQSIPEVIDIPEFLTEWESFLQMRREKKKPMTETAKVKNLNKLARMGAARAIAALQFSTENEYQGIFEPDHRNAPKAQTQQDIYADLKVCN